MFWSLTVRGSEPQTVVFPKTVHISAAVLDLENVFTDGTVSVYARPEDAQETLICHLSRKKIPQVSLDLAVDEGESVTFGIRSQGLSKAVVHLSGYVVRDELDDEYGVEMEQPVDEPSKEVDKPSKKVDKSAKDKSTKEVDKSSKEADKSIKEVDQLFKNAKKVEKNKSVTFENSSEKPKPNNIDVLSALTKKITAGAKPLTPKKENNLQQSNSVQKRKTEPEKATPNKKAKLNIDKDAIINEEQESDEDDSDDVEESDENDESEIDSDDEDDEDDDDESDEEEDDESDTDTEQQTQTNVKVSLSTPTANKNKQDTPKVLTRNLEIKTPQTGKSGDKIANGVQSANKQKNKIPVVVTPKAFNKSQTETPKKQVVNKPHQDTPKPPVVKGKMSLPPTPKKTVLKGGVIVEDLKLGNGPEAKRGNTVGVYYTGRLQNGNKPFDQTLGGTPFSFELGAQQVIKGWDVGLSGMKVGSKRRIIIPPEMGYGSKGSLPVIPPNSTLVFEVELKHVKQQQQKQKQK